MEVLEGTNLGGAYSLQAASCNWKVWGVAVRNGQQIYIWGGGGVDLPGARQLVQWYRLEIKAIGNNLSFYIDDNLVLERKDSFNPSGGVQLWAFDCVTEFDNVVITGDDIPDAGPSGYAVEPEAKLATTWAEMRRAQ